MAFVLLTQNILHHEVCESYPIYKNKWKEKKEVKLFSTKNECLGAFIYLLTRSSFLKIVYLRKFMCPDQRWIPSI